MIDGGFEIDPTVSGPHDRQSAQNLQVPLLASGGGHRLLHAGDAGDDVVDCVAPGDPAASERREATGDARVDSPADPERDPAGLLGLGHHVDGVEGQLVGSVGSPGFGPQQPADLEGVVEPAATALEAQAGGLVLLALPAHAHADVEAAARQHVERCELLGQHRRAPQRGEQHVGAEAKGRSATGDERQERERFEPVPVGSRRLPPTDGAAQLRLRVGLEVLAEHHVVGHDDAIDAHLLGDLGSPQQGLPTARILGCEATQHDRQPGRSQTRLLRHDRCAPEGGVRSCRVCQVVAVGATGRAGEGGARRGRCPQLQAAGSKCLGSKRSPRGWR